MLPIRAALAVLTLAALPACSSSLFQDYTDVARPGISAFGQGRFEAAAQQFGNIKSADKDDAFLAYAEIGMARHVAGDPQGAIDAWLQAYEVLQDFEDRPTISGRTLTEGFVSALVNEKALPYDGEDFEVALLHGWLAWEFLRQGDLDGAMVEVARSYIVQRKAEKRYDNSYGMNRFTRFVAAVTQEVDASFDEAEIDLKQLQEELPGHPAIEYSLGRVQRLQGEGGSEERRLAQLIVVHEVGRMPQKVATEFRYQTKRSLGRVSLPAFGSPSHAIYGLEVELAGEQVGTTEVLEDILGVAHQNLEDRLAWLVAKGIGRAAAKSILVDQAAKEVEKKHGEGWGLVTSAIGSLLAVSSERADLRSWTTLPLAVEVLRVPIEPGEHSIRVAVPGRNAIDLGIHSFRAGRPVLVTVRSLGGRLYPQVGPVAVPSPAAPEPTLQPDA